jgi:hypothetical protein
MAWMAWVRFLAGARDVSPIHTVHTSFGTNGLLYSGYQGQSNWGMRLATVNCTLYLRGSIPLWYVKRKYHQSN